MSCHHLTLVKVEEENLGSNPHTLSFHCAECGEVIHKIKDEDNN